MYHLAMPTFSVSDARAALADIVDRVQQGEEVTITRHGAPVAVIVRPDRLRHRRIDELLAEAAEIHEWVESARHLDPDALPGLTADEAEDLIAEIRADRDSR